MILIIMIVIVMMVMMMIMNTGILEALEDYLKDLMKITANQ